MRSASNWFPAQGFTVLNAPGVSRAWRLELLDGSYLLVTDPGGYDLPDPGGPYSVIVLSAHDELLKFVPTLWRTQDLYHFLRSQQRLQRRRHSATSLPTTHQPIQE